MDLFPDGSHVRLRSRVLGTYISANEDGVGISLSPRRASLNSAWVVHRIMHGGISFVLLHGAAYGRYLALSSSPDDDAAPPPPPAPRRRRGSRVAQRDRDDFDPDPEAILWRAIRGWDDGDDVLIRHDDVQRNLRANAASRLLPWSRASVTVDRLVARRSKMMRWVVEAIPPRAAPPELPPPVLSPNVGAPRRRGLFRRRAKPAVDPERTIWYVLADEDGNVNDLNWEPFSFSGRSVFNLRARVAFREGVSDATLFTLCVKGGNEGRPTPLVVDLPSGPNAMTVIALITGSPGAAALVYPDVDAEAS
ncbi:unnamed protein product [Urochloa humidicola]